jgi:hypothetical protein
MVSAFVVAPWKVQGDAFYNKVCLPISLLACLGQAKAQDRGEKPLLRPDREICDAVKHSIMPHTNQQGSEAPFMSPSLP